MKYYDITYKTPIVFDGGYPSLGKLNAMSIDDSASIDEVRTQAIFLITVGVPWNPNELEILDIVETPEENRPRPHPQGDFIED